MVKKLLLYIIASVLGIFLAIWLAPNVQFNGSNEIIVITGVILGLVNFFIKPILKLVSFPLQIITLGFFNFVINIFLVWLIIDVLSPIEINGLFSLLITTFIIWILNFLIIPKNKQ